MAAIDWSYVGNLAWTISTVAIGLGLVIFVHELGHFLVAKLCGVKCEKFYIGFDIPIALGPVRLPSRFCRVQWGETEYGIGILPLGGYVKMLGQDDNPANAQREAERIRVAETAPEPAAATGEPADGEPAATGEAASFQLDPRSYPAKAVPLRMAIISAGVVMNLVFAVVFATFAFNTGVPYTPCEIGGTAPGSPAWRQGLQPGSRILQLTASGGKSEHLRWDWDLKNAVGMAGGKEDLQLVVRNPDGIERSLSLRPMVTVIDGDEFPMLGIEPAIATKLGTKRATTPGYPADSAHPALQGGDRITAINGQPIQDGLHLMRTLANQIDRPLILMVEREDKRGPSAPRTQLTTIVKPNRAKRLGLVLDAGPISGIEPNSPAARAGLRIGDRLVSLGGQPLGDPMTLALRIREFYGREVNVIVQRTENGESAEKSLPITPRAPTSMENVFTYGSPLGVRSLGIVLPVIPRVVAVKSRTPAAAAGLRPGDEIVSVAFVSDDPKNKTEELINAGEPLELDDTITWPFVYDCMQQLKPDALLSLTYRRNGQLAVAKIKPVATDEPYADRGLVFALLSETRTAANWGEAMQLGFRQTAEDAYRVVDFLRKLFAGSISPKNLGGPISIAAVAGSEASQGISRLLMFLTFLSANLAVLNFLPIPALDGGHMVFLAAEGIRGKPVDERMQVALTLAGVACLLGLMIFVVALDIGRFFL
jgi:regulator of sigma E protease